MIHIANFETEFKGRKFKSSTGTEYVCVGYGDNNSNGNPYLVGLYKDATTNRVTLKTTLLKDIEFIP